MRDLYEQLERSEARHFELYLNFAEREFDAGGDRRAARRSSRRAKPSSPPSADSELRFHSGSQG